MRNPSHFNGAPLIRKSILAAVAVVLATGANADPISDILQQAYAGNTGGVEAIVTGTADITLQRDLMWALSAMHPDTMHFTEIWAKEEPENPVALTARAWSLFNSGQVERGEHSVRNSWPPSLQLANQMFDEAFGLAAHASELAPGFLPASDAVILIGKVSGHRDAMDAEIKRILTLMPNRHSLVLAAAAQSPNWGGSIRAINDLCQSYAGKVTNVTGYTPDACVADTVFRAGIYGDKRNRAVETLGKMVDNPMMDRALLEAAQSHSLPEDVANRLRARMLGEDRLTVDLALSGRPDILSRPGGFPEVEAFAAALKRDLVKARLEADRDRGSPQSLLTLSYLFDVEVLFARQTSGLDANPNAPDVEEKSAKILELDARNAAEMEDRALRLLEMSPRNVKALLLGARYLDNRFPDALDSGRWTLALSINAAIYSNYQSERLGRLVFAAKYGPEGLRLQTESGSSLPYSQAQLDEVYACPYVRALRLLELVCSYSEEGLEDCFRSSGLSHSDEMSGEYSLLEKITARGACAAEREKPVEELLFSEIDLGL